MTVPTFKQAWMPLLLAAMTFVTAYLGNDVYQTSQEPTTVTVNVESMPSSATRSEQDVKAIAREIAKAIMKEHEGGKKFH